MGDRLVGGELGSTGGYRQAGALAEMRRKQEHEGGLGRIIVGIAIVIDIHEDVERVLRASWGDVEGAARDAFLADCYRRGTLRLGGLAELLRVATSLKALEWLRGRGMGLNYAAADLADDQATLTRLGWVAKTEPVREAE